MLSEALRSPLASPDFFYALSAIGRRKDRLLGFVKAVDDEFFDEDLRTTVAAAVECIGQLNNQQVLEVSWTQLKASFLREDDIRTLKLFSRTARHYRPLPRVLEEERDQIVKKIDELQHELSVCADLPEWAKEPLREGLGRLRLVVLYFILFGHEEAIDQLLLIRGQIEAIATALLNAHEPEEKRRHRVAVLALLMTLLSTAIEVFTTPQTNMEALQTYRGWARDYISSPPTQISPPPKLLEAPTAKRGDAGSERLHNRRCGTTGGRGE